MTEQPPDETAIALDEVLAEMDDLGRAKWDAAFARVENRKLRAELARLTNGRQAAPPDPAATDAPGGGQG